MCLNFLEIFMGVLGKIVREVHLVVAEEKEGWL